MKNPGSTEHTEFTENLNRGHGVFGDFHVFVSKSITQRRNGAKNARKLLEKSSGTTENTESTEKLNLDFGVFGDFGGSNLFELIGDKQS